MQSSSVAQAGTTLVAFTIARDASTAGALTVHVDGLRAGVTADDVGVAAGVSMGTITFAATAASTVGSSTDVTVELLTAPGATASGAVSTLLVRAAVSADYALTTNLAIVATPFAFTYSPAPSGFQSTISSLTTLAFLLGVEYRH